MLLSEAMVGGFAKLKANVISHLVLIKPVVQESKKEVTMLTSVTQPGYQEENRISAA